MQNKWLWGCGIGCGALILLVGLVGLGLAGYGVYYKDKAVSALVEQTKTEFEQRKQEGKIRPELQEPMAELITLLQRPEIPLMAGMTIIGVLAEVMTNESADPEKSLAALKDFRDLLKANPTPTMQQLGEVYSKHEAFLDSLGKPRPGQKKEPEKTPQPESQ